MESFEYVFAAFALLLIISNNKRDMQDIKPKKWGSNLSKGRAGNRYPLDLPVITKEDLQRI